MPLIVFESRSGRLAADGGVLCFSHVGARDIVGAMQTGQDLGSSEKALTTDIYTHLLLIATAPTPRQGCHSLKQ